MNSVMNSYALSILVKLKMLSGLEYLNLAEIGREVQTIRSCGACTFQNFSQSRRDDNLHCISF